MHPKLHISTPVVYFYDPNKISGARYHRVATYSVKIGSSSLSFTAIERASPKSQTFTLHSEFNNILDGLRSRCKRKPIIFFIKIRVFFK
jgi:hypothetical protein